MKKIHLPQLRKSFDFDSEANREMSLLTALLRVGVPMAHSCAGEGICGTCACEIKSKQVTQVPRLSVQEEKLQTKHKLSHPKTRFSCLIALKLLPEECEIFTSYW